NVPGVMSLFAAHHPTLSFVAQQNATPLTSNMALQSVARPLFGSAYFPASVVLTLQGHMHDFQAIGFAGGAPPTLVVGISGDVLDPALPNPFRRDLRPAPDVPVAT